MNSKNLLPNDTNLLQHHVKPQGAPNKELRACEVPPDGTGAAPVSPTGGATGGTAGVAAASGELRPQRQVVGMDPLGVEDCSVSKHRIYGLDDTTNQR